MAINVNLHDPNTQPPSRKGYYWEWHPYATNAEWEAGDATGEWVEYQHPKPCVEVEAAAEPVETSYRKKRKIPAGYQPVRNTRQTKVVLDVNRLRAEGFEVESVKLLDDGHSIEIIVEADEIPLFDNDAVREVAERIGPEAAELLLSQLTTRFNRGMILALLSK